MQSLAKSIYLVWHEISLTMITDEVDPLHRYMATVLTTSNVIPTSSTRSKILMFSSNSP